MNRFHVEIVGIEKVLYKGEVEMVSATTTEGSIGIMSNHLPLIAMLKMGELSLKIGLEVYIYFISSGILEFANNNLVIFSDKVMKLSDISLEECEKEIANLEKKIEEEPKNILVKTLLKEEKLKEKLIKKYV